jgi:hypothetical protein
MDDRLRNFTQVGVLLVGYPAAGRQSLLKIRKHFVDLQAHARGDRWACNAATT